ncbi:MAG TPA: molybdopterin dinucleotide binding domain-containing protein [Polyangiaceae bacterium]
MTAAERRPDATDAAGAPPTIDDAGALPDLHEMPAYLMPGHEGGVPQIGRISCSFCGVGDGGTTERVADGPDSAASAPVAGTSGRLWVSGRDEPLASETLEPALLHVSTTVPLVAPGAVVRGEFETAEGRVPFVGREIERHRDRDGAIVAHVFRWFSEHLSASREVVRGLGPTAGCVKLRHSMMRQRPAFPIHTAPSVLDPQTGRRKPVSYGKAIALLARLLLDHRGPAARTLVYASGQVDYFAVFAMQEVFRLLGVRNLTGNAEHCLNAGAVHNEMLTGQEGPFLTIEQAVNGPNRFFLFNGWNGFIAHPPVFRALLSRPDLDAYLVEVMVTESAKALAEKLGKERVLLVRPRSDPHLALAVAHEIATQHPGAVSARFVDRFADRPSFEAYLATAASEQFAPERVAPRIAAEPEYAERLLRGIQRIAAQIAADGVTPINIPSVGLSQTSGAVAHCLWGSALALAGKYGLRPGGEVAGGTLRLPGQINAETEVQGLSRKYFMGRIPMAHAAEAARRMGLPEDAYDPVLRDPGRAALDYSDPTPGTPELFLCFGTQFEANMMGRPRWIEKLRDPANTLVVVDPIPDPFTERHARLVIPSPPHPATAKLYQNGEWKLTLSVPQKIAAPETRSDATILYDTMAEVTRVLATEPSSRAAHPDLAGHLKSGYLAARFSPPGEGGGLTRIQGEVSRAELWQRILAYMTGGGEGETGAALYCRPEHAGGRPVAWTELVERGSVYYGGVGSTRYVLDYDDPEAHPFGDVFRRPGKFRFFVPTQADLEIPTGTIFNSGRSTLSDERERIAFAVATFNSGKATPVTGMPDENPLFVSPSLARKRGIATGQRVRVRHPRGSDSIELPVVVSDRVKGDVVYASFHKSRAQMERGVYVNDVTSHEERCPYTSQSSLKATPVVIEEATAVAAVTRSGPVPRKRIDTTQLDPLADIPVWPGRDVPLHVTDVIADTHDVYTLRLQGEPLCRFAYWPGQFCTLSVEIDGKRAVRSYSISSPPTRPFVLEVTIKRVPGGLVSNWLADHVHVGDVLDVSGPKGKFCLVPGRIPSKLLLLGAGSGITPIMSMARWLCDVSADVDVKLFNSVRSPSDVIFHRELELMSSRYRMFEPMVITSSRTVGRGWTGLSGRISRPMLDMVAPDLHDRHVYMCGPDGFMDAARELLTQAGFDLSRLHAESFAPARSAPNTERPSPANAPTFTVEFARTGKRVTGGAHLPLLDLAETHDIELDYACRTGNCGECKVRLLRGQVSAATDVGLTPKERDEGFVLSCVASPASDCAIDA